MTNSQRLTIRASEIRSRLNDIAGMEGDALTDEVRSEEASLQTEFRDTELRLRAAIGSEPDTETRTGPVDSEVRERLQLRGKTSIGEFLAAAAGGRAVTGAAAEYAAASGCADLQRVPMAIFTDGQPEEHRAITTGPAVDGPVMPRVPYVFERSAAAALGIEMPVVAAGQVQTPRVSTAPPADAVAKEGAAPSTAAVISLDSQSPKRIAGQFEIRVEDLAVYPEMEQVLSEAIQGALANELDEQIFNGTNAGGDLNGLFKQASDQAIDGATETYGTGIARFAGLVDGKHAYGLGDVRAVIGPATFAKYAGLFANANKGDVPLADYLAGKLGAFRVSDRMPAVANSGQKGIVVLSAGPTPIRLYVWSALEIVRDPYSGAGAGKVILTATALVSDVYIPHTTSQVKEIHPKLS